MQRISLFNGVQFALRRSSRDYSNSNYRRPPKKFTDEQMKLIYEEYSAGGITQAKLADKWGCAVCTLLRVLEIMRVRDTIRKRKLGIAQ